MGNCEANARMVSGYFAMSYHKAAIERGGTTWPNSVDDGL
jgi:hypothetical protein